MRILWSSNAPWAASGYGNQTRLFVERLRDAGHDMALHAWFGLHGGVLSWKGIPTYPGCFHPYGQDIMVAHANHFKPDLIITLVDAWVLEPDPIDSFGHRWCPWFPVDMEPLAPAVLEKVRRAYQPIVFSKYGARLCQQAGLHALYVPHGVETEVFAPVDRRAAREKLGFPTDVFLAGMVAANKGTPSRKSFPQVLGAFRQFRQRHPDSRLYLHTHAGPHMEGLDLHAAVDAFDLGDAIIWPDEYTILTGAPDEQMRDIYNALDVLVSPSMGEGFGIPIVEAQACGTPVIVGDWTAMSELCFAGWAIPKSESDPWWWPIGGTSYIPRVGAILDALEAAYQALSNSATTYSLHEQARTGALAYDADAVTRDYWLPTLSRIEARIRAGEPEEVAA